MAFADIRLNAEQFRQQNYDVVTKSLAMQTTEDDTECECTTIGLAVGMKVSGAGIPDGATIATITDNNTLDLSADATSTSRINAIIEILSDDEIELLKYTAAIEKIKQDLQSDLNIPDSDLTTALEKIYTNYSGMISAALLACQAMYYYFELGGGTESNTYRRYSHYKNEYEYIRKQYGKIKISESISVNIVRLIRG